jgi:hypothetical protein
MPLMRECVYQAHLSPLICERTSLSKPASKSKPAPKTKPAHKPKPLYPRRFYALLSPLICYIMLLPSKKKILVKKKTIVHSYAIRVHTVYRYSCATHVRMRRSISATNALLYWYTSTNTDVLMRLPERSARRRSISATNASTCSMVLGENRDTCCAISRICVHAVV